MAATGKRALLLADDVSIPLNAVLSAFSGLDLGMDLVARDHDVRVITQAASLGNFFSFPPFPCQNFEFGIHGTRNLNVSETYE